MKKLLALSMLLSLHQQYVLTEGGTKGESVVLEQLPQSNGLLSRKSSRFSSAGSTEGSPVAVRGTRASDLRYLRPTTSQYPKDVDSIHPDKQSNVGPSQLEQEEAAQQVKLESYLADVKAQLVLGNEEAARIKFAQAEAYAQKYNLDLWNLATRRLSKDQFDTMVYDPIRKKYDVSFSKLKAQYAVTDLAQKKVDEMKREHVEQLNRLHHLAANDPRRADLQRELGQKDATAENPESLARRMFDMKQVVQPTGKRLFWSTGYRPAESTFVV